MKIYMDIGYMVGHLRYGHCEGYVDMTKEEEEEFQTLLRKEIVKGENLTEEEENKLYDYKERILEHSHFVVDDYELDDYGDFEWSDLLD